METAKTGKQVMDNFISSLKNDSLLDVDVVSTIIHLYEKGMLTEKALLNELEQLRTQTRSETTPD